MIRIGLLTILLFLGACATGDGRDDGDEHPAGPGGRRLSSEPTFDPALLPRDEEPSQDKYVSSWGRVVLSRCFLLVRGRVIKTYRLPKGVAIANFEVMETLYGPGADGVTLMVATADPDYFAAGDELLLFLERGRDGAQFSALDKVNMKSAEGPGRMKAVRRYLALESTADPDGRLEAFKAMLFEFLDSPDRWFRENALRELHILTLKQPGLFAETDLEALADKLLILDSEVNRNRLRYVLAHLEILPLLQSIAAAPGSAEAEEALSRMKRLVDETGEDAVRIRAREDVIFQGYRTTLDPARRAAIVSAAASLRRPRLFTGVVKALWDVAFEVRLAALKGLAGWGSKMAAKAVALRLQDRYPDVRRQAAITLGFIGRSDELDALMHVADEKGETRDVREAARQAMAAIRARE